MSGTTKLMHINGTTPAVHATAHWIRFEESQNEIL